MLIIERDDLLRWALTEAATDSGYAAIAVPDVAAARGTSDERLADAMVVLVDGGAPQFDGVGLAALRARLPDSVLAVMTGDAASGARVRSTWPGVSEVFVKPFDLHAVQAYLRAVAGQRAPGHTPSAEGGPYTEGP